MTRTLAILACASLAGTLAAQPAVRALPRVCTDAYGGSVAFATPSSSFRAQYWYSGDNMPIGWPILEIGIRLRQAAFTPMQTRSLQIVVENSTVTFAGMSPTFANNVTAGATTFFANRPISFAAFPGTSDPNDAAAWIPGDNLFVFTGPNLLIDFTGGDNGGAGNALNDGLLIQAPGAVTAHLLGSPSCGGQLGAAYDGTAVQLTATGLVPGTMASFHIGAENVYLGGTIPLPLDLAIIGLQPGCHFATDPFVTAQRPVDGSGVATLTIPIGISPASTLMFSAQVFHFLVPLPTSIADVASTNAVHNAIGYAGLCNTTYAPSSSAATATNGPNPINSAIALLIR